MSSIETLGINNLGNYKSYDVFPRQCIIAGRRGAGPHTVSAEEAGNYFFKGFLESDIAEGRQFLDYDNTQGYSNVPFINELNLSDAELNAIIINASATIECTGTTRRYMQIALKEAYTDNNLYNLSLASGAPDASNRLNLSSTTIVTPSAFNVNIWPTLQFNLQEGDIIGHWAITAILQ